MGRIRVQVGRRVDYAKYLLFLAIAAVILSCPTPADAAEGPFTYRLGGSLHGAQVLDGSGIVVAEFDSAAKAVVFVTAANKTFEAKRIVYSDPGRSGWTSDASIDGHSSAASTIDLGNCFRSRSVTVAPYGVAIVRNYGADICGPGIGLLNVGTGIGARLQTVARYRAGHATMTLTFPALEGSGITTAADEFRAGPASNVAGADVTFALLFNEGSTDADATLLIYDGRGAEVGREFVRIPARRLDANGNQVGGSLFYPLTTQFGEGSVRLRGGTVWRPGNPSGFIQPTFGYAIVGPVDGTVAPQVIPFTRVQ